MTKLIRGAVFVLVLCAGAQADGVMQTDKTQPPLPATDAMQDATEVTADGIMQTDLTVAARELARSLLENLLTLF